MANAELGVKQNGERNKLLGYLIVGRNRIGWCIVYTAVTCLVPMDGEPLEISNSLPLSP